MEVAQRHVVGAVEHARGHGADAADRDVAFGVTADRAGDERVGHHDRRPASHLAAGGHPLHGRPEDSGVGALSGSQRFGGRGRLEVRERVDRDAVDHHRRPDRGQRRPDVEPRPLQEAGSEPQPDRGVVVAGGQDDLGARIDEPGDRLGEELDGRGAGQGAVVDVTAHQHGIDVFFADDLDEVVDVAGLDGQHPHTVERASQVPVGGVDQPHVPRLGRPGDRAGNLLRRAVPTAADVGISPIWRTPRQQTGDVLWSAR